jgi:hypothetical protein
VRKTVDAILLIRETGPLWGLFDEISPRWQCGTQPRGGNGALPEPRLEPLHWMRVSSPMTEARMG